MQIEECSRILVEQKIIVSTHLSREVIIDVYRPKETIDVSRLSLLLINDGQDLKEMNFSHLLNALVESDQIAPLFCIGIHAGKDRKMEYGTARILDYAGRGTKAHAYNRFVLEELLPFIHVHYGMETFSNKAFAGFSLGGLTAMDMVWHHPDIFSIAGVFSGALWWRLKDLDQGYNEAADRIMHQQIKKGHYHPGLRFYFTTGSLDETADRNHNGIIDSIDDTLDLIKDLKQLGYNTDYDIRYVNYEEGRHDVASWGKAMPGFLLWGWGR